MKVTFLFTAILFLGFNCSDLKSSVDENDTRVYSFINYFLERKQIPAFLNDFPILDQALTHYKPDTKDSVYCVSKGLLSSEDWQYIVAQTKLQESFKIDSNKVKVRNVLPSKSLKSFNLEDGRPEMIRYLKTNYGVEGFNTLSRPLFSLDGTKVIVRYEFFLKGGGMGGDYVFVKREGGWELLDQLQIWEY